MIMAVSDYYFSEAGKIVEGIKKLFEEKGESSYVVGRFNRLEDAMEYFKNTGEILEATSSIKLIIKESPRFFIIQAYTASEDETPTKKIRNAYPSGLISIKDE
jgi:hypothetical protein